MIEALFKELIWYLEFLKKNHNLNISIHDVSGFTGRYLTYLLPYNIHNCSYCLEIKSDPALWKKCHQQQVKVMEKLGDGIHFGKCYAGVYEYTIPMRVNRKPLLFISVGSYRKKHCKTDHKKYMELSTDIPKQEFVRNISSIILRYLHFIYDAIDQKEGISFCSLSENDYIYSHIIAYLKENYREKITVWDISRFCHYSVSYISHLFKQRNGKNISEYINGLRIEEAKRLLRNTLKSIKEIAFMTGFSDSNYFSNVFRKNTGKSPKEYRKSLIREAGA